MKRTMSLVLVLLPLFVCFSARRNPCFFESSSYHYSTLWVGKNRSQRKPIVGEEEEEEEEVHVHDFGRGGGI